MFEYCIHILVCCSIDIFCYLIADVIAKFILKDVATVRSEGDCKLVWLYEVIALSIVSLCLYTYHHPPYLLAFMTSVTFVTSQLCSRTDVMEISMAMSSWWYSMTSWWEEHRQMKDSMYQQPANHVIQRPASDTQLMYRNNLPLYSTSSLPYYRYNPAAFDRAKTHADNSQLSIGGAAYQHDKFYDVIDDNNNGKVPRNRRSETRNNNRGDKLIAADDSSPTNKVTHPVNHRLGRTSSDFRARGTTSSNRKPRRVASSLQIPPSSSLFGTLKNGLATAFGAGATTDKTRPPGLRNAGQNLCFINAVVQCLSQTPGFATQLMRDLERDIDCDEAESGLVYSFAELLSSCGSRGPRGCLDQLAFRDAASQFSQSPVYRLDEAQPQQDAAEFLTWVLTSTQQILNRIIKGRNHKPPTPSFTSERLVYLENIYGELSPQRVEEIAQTCRREIDVSNAVDSHTYSKSVRSLADLEWLAHRRDNDTVIDRTFGGQIIEAFHCVTYNHMTVTTQPFNILSLPLAKPSSNGAVRLDDCFARFSRQEQLIGTNGLQCAICNNVGALTPQTRHDLRASQQTRRHSTTLDSAIINSSGGSVSPIISDATLSDSGYYDTRFRTSTPIADQSRRTPLRPQLRPRDAERRCLLGVLPPVLVVQLGRFIVANPRYNPRKNNQPVSIPLQGLCVDSSLYDVTMHESLSHPADVHELYDLYAFCVHLGASSVDCGHYVAYCEDAATAVWHRFDDGVVQPVNIAYELQTREVRENAYLLFYRQSQGGDTVS